MTKLQTARIILLVSGFVVCSRVLNLIVIGHNKINFPENVQVFTCSFPSLTVNTATVVKCYLKLLQDFILFEQLLNLVSKTEWWVIEHLHWLWLNFILWCMLMEHLILSVTKTALESDYLFFQLSFHVLFFFWFYGKFLQLFPKKENQYPRLITWFTFI